MSRSNKQSMSTVSPLRGSRMGIPAGGQGMNDNRNISELIRDISGITFNDNGTPDK